MFIKALRKPILIFWCLTLMCLLSGIPAHSALVGSEMLVSGNDTTKTPDVFNQQNAHAIYLPDQNLWLVVWEDWRNVGNLKKADVLGRFVAADGTQCGSEFLITDVDNNFTTTDPVDGNQTNPRAAYRETDRKVVVAWQDSRANYVYYKSFTLPAGPANCAAAPFSSQAYTVNAEAAVSFHSLFGKSLLARKAPRIVYDAIRDRFIIVFAETRDELKGLAYSCFDLSNVRWDFGDSSFIGYVALNGATLAEVDVYGTGFTADVIRNGQNPPGTTDYQNVRMIENSSDVDTETREFEFFGNLNNPDVMCSDTVGGCMIVWEGVRNKGTLTCDCTIGTTAPTTSCNLGDLIASSLKIEPYAVDNSSISIFALFDNDVPHTSLISQLLNSNGAASFSDTSGMGAYYPSLGYDPISQRFLAAWEDNRDKLTRKIWGQLVYANGGLYGFQRLISFQDTNGDGTQDASIASSNQTRPFVSYDSVNQRFFVAWQDGRNSGESQENLDVFGQFVDGEGSLRGSNFALNTNPANQLLPALAFNDLTNQFLAVWKDARNDTTSTCGTGAQPCGSDIYGRRFTLGQPQLTLLNLDNSALLPPVLNDFHDASGTYTSLGNPVVAGQFDTQTFKIRNTGDALLSVDCMSPSTDALLSPFRFDGLSEELKSCSDGKTIDLVPGAEMTVTVRFSPTVSGSFNKSFDIYSNGDNIKVNMSGLSIAPDITVSPASLAFSNVNVGSTKDLTLTVSNDGLANLQIASITPPSVPYTIKTDGCTGQTITAGNSCSVVVTLAPKEVKSFDNYLLAINSNDPTMLTLNVDIDGTGLGAPEITVTPTTIAFGNVNVGQTKTSDITVKNDGTTDLTLGTPWKTTSPSSPFSISATTCSDGLKVATGNSCTVTIAYTPTAETASASTLVISSDDSDEAAVTVNLSGTGVVVPDISTSPSPVNFGDVVVGASSDKTITVTNSGAANLTISAMTNPSAPYAIVSDTCLGATIATGGTCATVVRFTPTAGGTASSSYTITSNDPDQATLTVTLNGTGKLVPVIAASSATLAFGSVKVSATLDKTVTVTNTGSASLVISAVSSPASPFSVVSETCTAAAIASAKTCTVTARYSPTATGASAGSFTISSNDATTPVVTVSLSGTGLAVPDISSSPSPVNFGDVVVGASSDKAITVTNSGAANLTISAMTNPSAPYAIVSDTCLGATIATGGTCATVVRFTPKAGGTASSSYAITSNDPDQATLTVTLNGTGSLVPVIAASSAALAFGSVGINTSVQKTLTVSNTGSSNLVISSVSALAAPFSIVSESCTAAAIAPSGTCLVIVQYTPTASAASAATVNIASNDSTTPVLSVNITGTGVSVPDISISDPASLSLDFGYVAASSTSDKTITVKNVGAQSLTVSSVSTPGAPFSVVANTCTAAISSGGGTCSITVRYSPTTQTTSVATLNIVSNDPDTATVTISLSGRSAASGAANISLSASNMIFGDVAVGATSDTVLTVTNTGSSALSITGLTNPANNVFTIISDACAGRTLSGGGTCTTTLRFTPTAIGVISSSFTISSNDSDTPTATVNLFGTGSVLLGDINGDKAVSAADALLALRIAVGLDAATSTARTLGDVAPLVSGKPVPDGEITATDALVILLRATGKVSF